MRHDVRRVSRRAFPSKTGSSGERPEVGLTSLTRCYDYCATPTPDFEVPTCQSGTGTEEPQPTGTDDGGWSIDEQCEEEGSFIICADGIDDCGNGWGE